MASINDQQFDSESDGGDFNPTAHVGSDDEDVRAPGREKPKQRKPRSETPNSDAEDDDDEDVKPSGRRRIRNGRRPDDEDDDGEDDDDEEDDEGDDDDNDDEDEGVRPHKRQKQRTGYSQFIDREAEVTEEEDEDEDDEDGDIGDEPHPEDLGRDADDYDDRKHREYDRLKQRAEEIVAEKLAVVLKERYGRQRVNMAEASAVPQHLLLPSVKDPSVYAIKCKIGKEQEVVYSILKRIAETLDNSLAGVTSVFAREKAMQGYIYVEAEKKPDVAKATENVIFCYAQQMTVIPINEMPDLLRVKKPKEIKQGSFVRMRRPAKYMGDLAQIIDVEMNNSEVTVKLIPRLEFGDEENGAAAQKRKRPGASNYRPPQKLFNESEVRKRAPGRVQHGASGVFFYQSDEFENGFLIKVVKTNFIETENVNPTLEEATKFAASGEDGEELDLTALAASLRQTVSSGDFIPGDMVEVFQGEQQGIRGKTLAIHSDVLTLEVTEGQLRGTKFESPIKAVRKLFTEGDNVKVLSGSKYSGETGMVLKVEGDFVSILTNSNNERIKVFSKDLRVAVDSDATITNSKYNLFDIVLLDATRVGCIIKVDRETIRVIDQDGSVKTVLPSSISGKLDEKRKVVATDRTGAQIEQKDTIREHGGSQRRGEIIGIHRNYVFAKDRVVHQNLGVWATKSSNVELLSAKGARQTDSVDISGMNPMLRQNGAMAPPAAKINRAPDRLEGKTVMITKGDYKGMVGRVKSTTSALVSVELEARSSKFPTSFPRDILKVKDTVTGQFHPIGMRGPRTPGGTASSQQATSAWGNSAQLPSRAPSGSRTPMGISGNRTPAWGMNDGARTPAWKLGGGSGGSGGYDGGKTPAWGAGSARTPAYRGMDDGNRTVMHQSDGSRTSYGGGVSHEHLKTQYLADIDQIDYSGGKTPAYPGFSGNAPTPGASGTSYSSNRNYPRGAAAAPTPGAIDAPTPGAYLGAPTPGAFDAPTPRYGAYGTPAANAPTPGAFAAETPGGFAPETPAAFGGDDDDGPTYDD
jgi:transcription elongation factor SPT5